MSDIDKRDRLKENPFSYKVNKDNKVMIFWDNKQIKILKGKEALKFLSRVEGRNQFEVQLELAKITGNFKRGNEK